MLAGIAICTKQSIGVTLAIIVVGYKLMFVDSKEQFKEYVKTAITRIIGILIPTLIFIVYLIVTHSLVDFINYAILGIKTFSNKINYISLFSNDKIEIRALALWVPISILVMSIVLIITNIQKKENEIIDNLTTLLVYGLAIIIVMYPISDKIHFLIGGLIAIIGMLYMFFLLGKLVYDKINGDKKLKIYKIVTSLIWLVMFAVILSIGLTNLYNYVKKEKNKEIKHYKYIEMSQGLKDKIKSIDNYILEAEQNGDRVYILDAEAAIYMIPIDRYNKGYDMFLKGNIGKDGEQGQIEKIKQKNDNEIILVRKSNLKTNWQTPKEVVKYVRENLEKIGEINIFEIYK